MRLLTKVDLANAIEKERQLCANDTCAFCRQDYALERDEKDGRWWHISKFDNSERFVACQAAKIWERQHRSQP